MDHDDTEVAWRLKAERETTLERLAGLRREFSSIVSASYDSNADDEHDPEGSTIAFERSQVDALVQQAKRHLLEVDEALQRLREGRYAVCEVCGERIPDARMVARPTARTCVACARGPGPN